MNISKKRLIAPIIILGTLFTSCTSTSVLGLSRASYVEEEIQRLNDSDADVQRLNEELSELSLEIDGLRGELGAAREADREILQMAEEFQHRLDALPRDALLELKSAIDTYLADHADG